MSSFRAFFEKNRITLQYIYGAVLIVLIPLLIAGNTGLIISRYTSGIDVMIQREGLSLGRTVYAFIKPDLANHDVVREKITALVAANSQTAEITLLVPADGSYRVVASSDANAVGKKYRSNYYDLAWAQPDNDGLATDYVNVSIEGAERTSLPGEGRYWLVAMPVSDGTGVKQAVLTIKLSSGIIDALAYENRKNSLMVLMGTIAVVVLFLIVAVRFWDYALLYRRIQEVDRMKDEFISMASHELRTPVTAIKGYASMMLEGTAGAISDKVKHMAGVINMASDGLALLVEDLLNVSRIEQGRMELERQNIRPDGIFKEVLDTLAVQAAEKHLELVYSPSGELLPEINVDPSRLKQVLINLVGNAIKYTEKGRVEVIVNGSTQGNALEIRIKDTGIGMSAAEQERLFEKFYRVKNEKVRNIRGTGLGLWITKRLVELMDGKISVASIENSGSQFTVIFPAVKSGRQ